MKLQLKKLFRYRDLIDEYGNRILNYQHALGCIRIAVRDDCVSEIIQKKIRTARYERREAITIGKILNDREVYLELGAGLGLISTIAWLSGRVREIHCFEADPRLVPLIQATHRLNSVVSQVHNQLLTGDQELINHGFVDFHIRKNFYGSSVNPNVAAGIVNTLKVPTRSIEQVLDEIKPTVIACDIEGAELGLFGGIRCPTVHRVMLETHQSAINGEGMRRLFNEMHDINFHYDERWSSGSVVVFSRIQ